MCLAQTASLLLRERVLAEEGMELLTAVNASSRILLTLVENVLLTKRLEKGAHYTAIAYAAACC